MSMVEPGGTVVSRMTRVAFLMGFAAILLGWLAAHTDILFADGLRYISQARAIGRGSAAEGLENAVDHPVYPLAIAVAHRLVGGTSPVSWQFAAQSASVLAGILLVLPLYLVVTELFGESAAGPACLLVYAVPLTGHVFADTLSESTFLLFWTCGLWGAIRFLKQGRLGWLPLVVVASALAYLTRPEGLLLPAALLVAVVSRPRWVLTRLKASRAVAISAGVMVGLVCLIGPYVAIKGGITSKPSVARLLGRAPKSAPHAVERQRPLDENQSDAKTWLLATKAVTKAITEAVTLPLAILAVVGLAFLRLDRDGARVWRLIGVIILASVVALMRLHATGGYCSPRHALVIAMLAIPTAVHGFVSLLGLARARLSDRSRKIALGAAMGGFLIVLSPSTFSHVNAGLQGYREAGDWLHEKATNDGRVVDVTGWSQFYADRPRDYTFENLVAAKGDSRARWVIVRESHLRGPWEYCTRLRELVEGREPVQVFQNAARGRATKVLVFDLSESIAAQASRTADRTPTR